MFMIGNIKNYDDVFFRDLTICLLDKLEGKVKWKNRFSNNTIDVDVPFYYSMSGDERFLLDSFVDDVVSNNRFVELNTDIIPRAHVTLSSFNIKSDEFRNPNVWLKTILENEVELKSVLNKVRAIPITVNYDVVIILDSEIDVFKCQASIMDTLWLYREMYFEYNFMHIDAITIVPDDLNFELTREQNLSSDSSIKLNFTLEVHTFYPAYFKNDDLEGQSTKRTRWFNELKDLNNNNNLGGNYDNNI